MRKIFIILLIFLVIPTVVYAGHIYYNGKVTEISEKFLTVDGNVYWISSDCRVAIHREVRGAIYEEPAKLSDIKKGDWVTVRLEGKTITEILIERYK